MTTVALVTIGVVVGYGGLGQLMFRGFQSNYHAEVMTATLLCVALALVGDVLLRLAGSPGDAVAAGGRTMRGTVRRPGPPSSATRSSGSTTR